MKSNNTQKGKPRAVITFCSADRPPPNNSVAASAPSNNIQKTRCQVRDTWCSRRDNKSITNAAESAEVVRKITMISALTIDVSVARGNCSRKVKSTTETSDLTCVARTKQEFNHNIL